MTSSSEVSRALHRTLNEIQAYSKEVLSKPDDFGDKDLLQLTQYIKAGEDALLDFAMAKGNKPINVDQKVAEGTLLAINQLMQEMQNDTSGLAQKKKGDILVALGALQEFQNALRSVAKNTFDPERFKKKHGFVDPGDESGPLGG